ncbi:hypothetical protein [Gabonia massiliensis]|uniref:hypothetical protein n=1 Tax=Gabonia massiliensis TaxID=1686296 RepID=UPI0012B621F9|nr:hypothetical protein [Gabonia massiliensis]
MAKVVKWMIWADRLVVRALAEVVDRDDSVYCLISIKQYYTNIIVYNIDKMGYYTNKIVFFAVDGLSVCSRFLCMLRQTGWNFSV